MDGGGTADMRKEKRKSAGLLGKPRGEREDEVMGNKWGRCE